MNLSELSNHHAILITHPERKDVASTLWEELQASSRAHRLFDSTVLDIETAREIISWSKSAYDGKRVGLISFHTAGIPAQNALLKVLEEPGEKMQLILVTSNKSVLIETVLSRLEHHDIQIDTKKSENKDAYQFLATAHGTRMKLPFITTLLTKVDEEDRKDREAVSAFILSLVETLRLSNASPYHITETIELASYASDPSSSGKALLEYLSLLLPQMKD